MEELDGTIHLLPLCACVLAIVPINVMLFHFQHMLVIMLKTLGLHTQHVVIILCTEQSKLAFEVQLPSVGCSMRVGLRFFAVDDGSIA